MTRESDDRRALFAAEYAKDRNGTRAAIAAGYAAGSAHVTASRLLKDAKTLSVVAKVDAKVIAKVERSAADIARKRWEIIDDPETPVSDVLTALRDEQRRFPEYSEKHEVKAEVDVVERRYIGVEVRNV